MMLVIITIFRPGLAYSRTTYLGIFVYVLHHPCYFKRCSVPGLTQLAWTALSGLYRYLYCAFFVEFLKDTAVLHTRALQAKIGKYFTVLHSPKVKIRIIQNFFIIPQVAPFKLEKSKVNTKLHFFGYYSTVQILRRRRRRKIRQISIG